MRLSEAIRMGSTMTLPYHGSYFYMSPSPNSDDTRVFACALGAAAYATGHTFDTWTTAFEPWPWLILGLHKPKRCPEKVCFYQALSYHQMVIHLNDSHKWAREKIADWVETVEPKPANPVTEVTKPAAEAAEPVTEVTEELVCV